jgi:hypothetical protein
MIGKTQLLLVVILLAIVLRVIFVWGLGLEPEFNDDSASYDQVATQIITLDFSTYIAERTPGYPLLIALCGRNHTAILVVQTIMGLLITFLLFKLTWMETLNGAVSACVALLYAAGMNFIYFERCVMTETFTTLLIVISVYCFRQMIYGENYQYARCLGVFTVMTTPGLVRPLMAYLPFLAGAYLPLVLRESWPRRLRIAAACMMPALAITLGLCAFNKYMVDTFSITSMTGLHLSDHIGAYIEDAPPEFSTIVNAYLDYRPVQIERSTTHQFTIMHILPRLQQELGLSPPELSKLLMRMDLELIRTHPVQYAKTVCEAWVNFWKAPALIFWGFGTFHTVARYQRIIYLMINGAFLILSLLAIVRIRTMWFDAKFEIFLIGMILTGSVLQALLQYGGNPRFAVPFQPIIFYVDAVLLWKSGIVGRFWQKCRNPAFRRSQLGC